MGLRTGLMFFACGLCLFFGVRSAWSTTENLSYLEAEVLAPDHWEESVLVRFAPDEARCVKAYGSHWRTLCSRALGKSGELTSVARLLPETAGEWRWRGEQELRFIPRAPLSPDTRYTVQLTLPALPPDVDVRPAILEFRTLPLAVAISEDHLWIDPSPRQAHAVSCTLRFTYPVDPDDMTPRVSLGPAEAASGLRLSRPQLIWNTTKDEAILTAPIEQLPQEPASIEVSVSGVPRLVEEQGRKKVLTGKNSAMPQAMYQFLVQGVSGLLYIRSATIETGYNAELGQEYQLHLETSLHVRPSDVAKALQLFQLPRVNTPEAVIPYNWEQAPAVPADVLERAVPLRIEPLQPADEAAGKMIFRIRDLSVSAPVRKDDVAARDTLPVFVYAWLPASFVSASGIQAGQPWQQILPATPHQAGVDFLQSGNILLLNGEQKLDLHSNGLHSIRWSIAQVREPFLALLAQPYSRFEEPPVDFSALSEVTKGEIRLPPSPSGTSQFSVLDVADLLRTGKTTKGLLFVRLDGIKDDKLTASASRFILVTDLGLMVKKSVSGIREAFVCSLASGEPAENVAVRILAANGLPVVEARTDASGKAVLPSVSGLRQEKRPVAIVAVQDNDRENVDLAWMPLEDAALEVDYTSFPTAGRFSRVGSSGETNAAAAGLSAYVFSQRGIYRPGETLYFGVLVRKSNWGTLPQGLPLEAVLVDPAGGICLSRLLTVERDGLSSVSWLLPEQAMSGRYRLHIRLPASGVSGGFENLGSATVRVEAFQPDTLELKTRVVPDPGLGWLTPFAVGEKDTPHVEIFLRNLYGLPAADRRIRATFEVTPTALSFADLPEYAEFFFPGTVASLTEHREVLPECRTDAEGRAIIPLPLSRYRSGTLRCSLLVEGFEPGGGRAVTRQSTMLVSSQQAVLGYRLTGEATSLEYIPQGRKTGLEWIALNAGLERIALDSLQFIVSERRSVTSLVTDATGQYHYDETPVDRELTRSTLSLEKGTPLRWTLPTAKPGDYLLRVQDVEGNTLASLPFMVAGESLRAPGELATGMLRLRLNKADYEAGETIQLQLSVPYDGFGLISLERDGVAAHQWFQSKAGETTQSIAIPDDFEGRGYVDVSFVRSLTSPDIYIRPHSVAVAPFTAAVRQRDMGLELQVPRQAIPGDNVLVTLTSRQPGKAVIFAVDEGVLQLTDYRTPSPLDYLLRDRALEVRTMQVFDRLMPDHGRLKGRIPGFGGDMAIGGGRFLNPFKRRGEPPVAFWSGIIEVNPEGTTLSIPIPDYYQGQVRIMAVGAWGGVEEDLSGSGRKEAQGVRQAAGCAQASIFVQGPVGLTPQLPVAVVPGDVFEGALAITCSGTADEKKSFVLQLEAGSAFILESTLPSSITLPGGAEKVIPFTLRVRDVPGEAIVLFTVTDAAGRSTSRSTTVSVRPTAPRTVALLGGETTENLDIPVQRNLYPYEATATLSVSSLPVPLMRGFARYLKRYPYGCVEQMISRAFPYVTLANRLSLLTDGDQSRDNFLREVNVLIESAARTIGEAFRADSGVSPWPRDAAWGTTQPDEALSVYAGDFMLSLRESGRETFSSVPGEALFRYIERLVNSTPGSLEEARIKAYGIWVLTREGHVMSQAVEQLIGWLEAYQHDWRKDVTASFLAGSCALMRMDQEARQLIAGYDFDPKTFQENGFFDALAVQAFHAVIVARHFPDLAERTALIRKQADRALNALRLNGFTTFSAAQGIRALAELSRSETAGSALDNLRLLCLEPEAPEIPVERMKQTSPDFLTFAMPECAKFAIRVPADSSGSSWFWQLVTDGYDRHPSQEAVSRGLEVTRSVLDPETGTPLSKVRLGDEVIVSVTARAHGRDIAAVALVDLLPGGFEMVLPREETLASGVDAEQEALQPKGLIRMDRREDRMVIFTDLAVSPQTYTYRIRAVNKGRFLLPPVQAEAMYDQSMYAHSGAGKILVE